MAGVYEKRNWYASYKDATGRRRNVATKATTKTEARRLAGELERQAERARHGLEPLPSDSTEPLGQLREWWLAERCPEASRPDEAGAPREARPRRRAGGLGGPAF